MGNRGTSASVERDMDPTPRRRRHSIEGFPPNLLGDSSRGNVQVKTERREDKEEERLKRDEEERLRREEEERLKREEERLKREEEERLKREQEEKLKREQEEKLKREEVELYRMLDEYLRELIEEIRVLSLEICPAPDDELDRVNMAKRSGARRGSTNRLKSLYEYTASDSEQERYKMTPILLSAPKRVSLAYFSIPSFVQLHRQANLSRSTPHSHALGGADTGKALLPPVLVSTLKDAMADLSLVGGGSLDETIRRILQAVLKDEVASELYWAGHGSKQSFQQANLQEVIFRASGKKYSGEAAFGDVGPHQHQHQLQLQLQHQQCMLVKAF